MKIIKFNIGDVLELKKTHPCGSKHFKVVRVGSEIRVICEGCGRDVTIPRPKLEKAVKKISPANSENN